MSSEAGVFLASILDSTFAGKFLERHSEFYVRISKENTTKLHAIWADVGLKNSEQEKELEEIASAVVGVWNDAVNRAEHQKSIFQSKIDEAISEIRRIREQLGEEGDGRWALGSGREKNEKELGINFDSLTCSTLKSRFECVAELLEGWKGKKTERLKEVEKLQGEIRKLKLRLGQQVMPTTAGIRGQGDISRAGIDYLKCELDSCNAERMRRERELENLLSKLRMICSELGEDHSQITQSAHPSFKKFFTPPSTLHCTLNLGGDVGESDMEVALNEETFNALEGKIKEMGRLREKRENEARDLCEMLNSLWDALEVSEGDVDRVILKRLMEGPGRLHGKSIEKCLNEVSRLEGAKAQMLRELIHKKVAEVQNLCEETHLPMPPIDSLLQIEGGDVNQLNCGQFGDVLSKLVRLCNDVQRLGQKRMEIIKVIKDLESMHEEVKWLVEYEQDDNRYKGRDCNRKLRRAIKAGKMRDKIPGLVRKLQEGLAHWEQTEGGPFIYDGKDFRNEVLDELLGEMQIAAKPEAKEKRKRAGGTGKDGNKNGGVGRSNGQLKGNDLPLTRSRSAKTPTPPMMFPGMNEDSAISALHGGTWAGGSSNAQRPMHHQVNTPMSRNVVNPLQERLNKLLQGPQSMYSPRTQPQERTQVDATSDMWKGQLASPFVAAMDAADLADKCQKYQHSEQTEEQGGGARNMCGSKIPRPDFNRGREVHTPHQRAPMDPSMMHSPNHAYDELHREIEPMEICADRPVTADPRANQPNRKFDRPGVPNFVNGAKAEGVNPSFARRLSL